MSQHQLIIEVEFRGRYYKLADEPVISDQKDWQDLENMIVDYIHTRRGAYDPNPALTAIYALAKDINNELRIISSKINPPLRGVVY